jgi:beta-N-acetylhexosaminidase
LKRLREIEMVPFKAYAEAKLASVMTAHVVFEAIDSTRPATMCPEVMTGLLRKELGFEGVVVSDDLEMKAIADYFSLEEATVLGALAGVDLFLVCHKAASQRRCIEALVKAVESGRVSRARIEDANKRLDAISDRFAHAPGDYLSTLGSAEHEKLAEGLHAAAPGKDPTEVLA